MFFFVTWELRGKFPDILDDAKYGVEARKLYKYHDVLAERVMVGIFLAAK